MRKIWLLALLPVLASCAHDKEVLPTEAVFETHASVMRGNYSGTVSGAEFTGQALTLNLTPTLINERVYTVSGTGTLAGNVLTVDGTVDSGPYKYIHAQVTSPLVTTANLTLKRTGLTDILISCMENQSDAMGYYWNCRLGNVTDTSFILKKS